MLRGRRRPREDAFVRRVGVEPVRTDFHVLGTCREHMLSWSPWADIEDEERRYFKGSVFPEVSLPQRIRRRLLTSLPWTSQC